MQSNTILLTLFILLSINVFGQDTNEENSRFFFELGIANKTLKDRSFSKLRFHGFIPSLEIGYENTKKNYWNIDLLAKYGIINYRNRHFPTTYIEGNLSIRYALPVSDKSWAGGRFRTSLNVLDYDGFDNGAWMTKHHLDVFLRHSFNISKHSFIGEFTYPLIGLASRPRYAGLDEFIAANSDNIPKILYAQNKIYTLHNYAEPTLRLKYIFKSGKSNYYSRLTYSYLYLNSVNAYFKHSIRLSFGAHL